MLTAPLLLAGGLAVAMPVGHLIPEGEDFRSQEIHRAKGEDDWPFAAEKGLLFCAPSLNEKLVYFIPENEEGEHEYPFALHDNVMIIGIVNIGRASVLRPYDNFEQLLRRLSPYIAMGKRLCDQPAGSSLPDSAL